MQRKKFPTPKVNVLDPIFLFFITLLSFSTRFYNLWYPNFTVFDEIYFANFTNYYSLSQYYHDIHPPLAKLLMYKIANLSGYTGDYCWVFNSSGHYDPVYLQLRITPAIFSALCSPLAYLFCRFLDFSPVSSFCSAFFICFENSFITEGRHILTDGILHFFCALHVTVLSYSVTLNYFDKSFTKWHILNGITLGFACSCKNTAWGLMVVDAFMYIRYLWQVFELDIFAFCVDLVLYGGSLLFINVFVYCVIFSIHFILLPLAGPGFLFLNSEMRRQVINNDNVNISLKSKIIQSPGLFSRSITHSISTHKGNMRIRQFHDSQSYPNNWPLMTGVMTYFFSGGGNIVRCIGNVFVYYFSLFSLIVNIFSFQKSKRWQIYAILIGYCSCYFPIFLIPRVLYNYHYLIPLFFGCTSYSAMLDVFFSPRIRGVVAVLSCFAVLVGFYLWKCYTYGLEQFHTDATIWTRNWIEGDERHKREKKSARR